MKKQLKYFLVLIGLLVLAPGWTQAAEIYVDDGDGTNGTCTLAEAILSANNDNADGNGCEDGSGDDIINLDTDVILAAELPWIDSTITIEGQEHIIDGNDGNWSVLQNAGDLTLNKVTVTGGKQFVFSTFNSDLCVGGGIYNAGTIILNESIVRDNSLSPTLDATWVECYGAGIYNAGTAILNNSTVSGNSILDIAGQGNNAMGGGIYNSGELTLTGSLVKENLVSWTGDKPGQQAMGGGIANVSSRSFVLNNSTIIGNSLSCSNNGGQDGFGGGISNYGDHLIATLNNSTISGNTGSQGGGIANLRNVTITLNNSTVSGNSGAGIDNSWDVIATLIHSTIIGNSSTGIRCWGGSTVTLIKSIVSGNSGYKTEILAGSSDVINADNFNVLGDSSKSKANAFSGFTPDPGSTDVIATYDGTNPTALSDILNPLADNGGPTKTHALVPDSPAIDLDATCSTELNTDQRGYPRPFGDGCDAGAFEFTEPLSIIVDADGVCTLADAITAANTDTATGGCPAGLSGRDTIILETDNTLEAALPEITSLITLEGQEHIIDGNNDPAVGSVLRIGVDGNLTMYRTTVTGANQTSASSNGGGILNYGTVTLIYSTVSGNSTEQYGGGIYNLGTLTLSHSTISDNWANFGGGIYNNSNGTVTLTDSTVSSNNTGHQPGIGGGIFNNGGKITLTNSTVSGNLADIRGGGIYNSAYMMLINSTVTGNRTSGSYGEGGGIYNNSTLTLTNATVSENLAGGIGGGIYNNSWNKTTFFSSIISGNQASGGGNEIYNYQSSNIIADSYNFFGHSDETDAQAFFSFTPGSTDRTATSDGTNPTALSAILSPLADNGGPTQTHALVLGSPAIDLDIGETCSSGLTEDQRGYPRPFGEGCDAGSFEVNCTSNIIVDAGGVCTLADAVTAANTNAPSGGCTAGCGNDTITLETDVTLEAALPQISSIITIEGQGHFISGNNDENVGSVLHITATGNLTLNDITITEGTGYEYWDGSFESYYGGGIYNKGNVTLNDSAISGNTNSQIFFSYGGGIYNASSGTVTLNDSAVSDNTAYSSFSGAGGGIYNSVGGTVMLTNSTVNGNLAKNGGGIYNYGTAMLTNSTVSDNTASGSSYSSGGGIYNYSDGTVTLTNSTVSD
ncbi:hypothetical protein VU12_00855, partial [Desulfobulbus sp. US4]|nr:hypothetical protein [Desulfobulbus sp. US4]